MVLPEKNWVNTEDEKLIISLKELLGEENIVIK